MKRCKLRNIRLEKVINDININKETWKNMNNESTNKNIIDINRYEIYVKYETEKANT